MQYLIDGHNLIPFVPGLNLSDMDDEERLVSLLQVHARVSRSRIEVYFDKAPEGRQRTRKVGMITVHSIRPPAIADSAIIDRIRSLKKTANGWSVVSHDRAVQDACRRLGARIVDSPEFTRMLLESIGKEQQRTREQPELGEVDVEEWLRLFKAGKDT